MFNNYKPMFNSGINNTTMLTVPLSPGVYEIIEDKKKYSLRLIANEFHVPDKIYGKLRFYINYYFKSILRHNFRTGILLTGIKGAGKSELAKVLCNKCIEHGLRAVNVSNVTYSKELIIFLETLDNTVFFFDEFSKIFRWDGQEKLLTFFSNTLNKERVVILTENNINNVSEFIRNRPGRARYAKHFDKLEIETVTEYMNDFDLDEQFKEDLLKLYKRTPDFTFDHLTAIVTEHIDVPDVEFKQLIELLNLGSMLPDKVLQLVSVKYIGDLVKYQDENIELSENVILTPEKPKYNMLTLNFNLTVFIKYENKDLKNKTLDLTQKDIYEMFKDTVSFRKDDYEVNFIVVNEDEWTSTNNSENSNSFNNGINVGPQRPSPFSFN